jgi:acyl carrier protein
VLGAVLRIISERTGYPIDMVEPDLDLEGDLSIDSIKRAEIVGELAAHLGSGSGVGQLTDSELEAFTKARTAAAITALLAAWLGSAAPAVEANEDRVQSTAATLATNGVPPKRFILERSPFGSAEPADGATLAGSRFVIVGGGSVGTELAAQLSKHGASISVAEHHDARTGSDGHIDGVIYLDSLAADEEPLLPEAFPTFQAALAAARAGCWPPARSTRALAARHRVTARPRGCAACSAPWRRNTRTRTPCSSRSIQPQHQRRSPSCWSASCWPVTAPPW